MNWFSLIPAALGALGGIMGGGQSSTTNSTSTQMSPALTQAANASLDKANQIWAKPYQQYTGERVAQPTASRAQLTPLMAQMGQRVTAGLNDANGYQAKISQLMGRGPARVQAPTMFQSGGPVATYTGG